MVGDPLLSTRLKIDRAKKHFADLNADVEAFKARDPFQVAVDESLGPKSNIYKLHVAEELPWQWAGAIGDIVHNLRASLDALATSVLIANGFIARTSLEGAYFPICRSSEELSMCTDFFRRAGPKVERLIRRLQPYKDGAGDWLWRLHKLDLLDKHRALIPVGSRLPSLNLTFPSPSSGSTTLMAELPPIPFRAHDSLRPLKEGDIVFRVDVVEEVGPSGEMHAHLNFEIAFGEGQVIDGEPLMPSLRRLITSTERVVDLFDRYIFSKR